jgi:hypothetical protein
MDDKADPLDGWPLLEVLRIRTTAMEDLYGKLHSYLQDIFRKFFGRLAAARVDFQLLHLDASQLSQTLQESKYTRIEVRDHETSRKRKNPYVV